MDQQSLILSRLSFKNKSLNNCSENKEVLVDQTNSKKVIKTQEKLGKEKNTFEFLAAGRINQRKKKNQRV